MSGGFEDRRVVRGTFRRRAMKVEQEAEFERLRGLRAEQPVARNRPGDHAIGAAFERVRDGHGGYRAIVRPQRRQKRGDRSGRNYGTGGIVDKDDVGRMRDERLKSGAHARLPRRAAGHRWQMRYPGERGFQGRGVADREKQRRLARQDFRGVADDRTARERQKLFRDPAAEPAAGSRGHQDRGNLLRRCFTRLFGHGHGAHRCRAATPRQPAPRDLASGMRLSQFRNAPRSVAPGLIA